MQSNLPYIPTESRDERKRGKGRDRARDSQTDKQTDRDGLVCGGGGGLGLKLLVRFMVWWST